MLHTFHTGCDLLEKSYFCSIANNCTVHLPNIGTVVICLKNRTFAVSQTTGVLIPSMSKPLWFAWKIVLLQYRKQHTAFRVNVAASCDLLEKSYFCSIANNIHYLLTPVVGVVIYLKNRTFAVSQTTRKLWQNKNTWLWFTWKIVLLQYRKQRTKK